MKSTFSIIAILVILTPVRALAHEGKKHAGTAVNGTVSAVASDHFQLTTDQGLLTVTYSAETIFEHDGKGVDSRHLAVGEHVTVHTTKLPGGNLGAEEVLIGVALDDAHGHTPHVGELPARNSHVSHPSQGQ